MKISAIVAGAKLGARRGDVVICVVSVGGAAVSGLPALLAHTPPEVQVIVCARRTAAPGVFDANDPQRELLWLEPTTGSEGEHVGLVLEAVAPADVVVLAGNCEVAPGWLERLRAAAGTSSAIATASTLPVDVLDLAPEGRRAWEQDAAAVAAAALGLRPRLPAAGGPCLLVRRSALELAGPFDEGFGARCLSTGLTHVLADDVLVRRLDDARDDQAPIMQADSGALARSVGVARRALAGLNVTVDARALEGPVTGSHVAMIELIGALARNGGARITVVLGENTAQHARNALTGLHGVTLAGNGAVVPRADVVHRPCQVATPADLAVLRGLGERLIITHHDLISYHTAGYFRDEAGWHGYRELTQAAMASADAVVFGSDYARRDALAEGLLEPGRAYVVPHGVDHHLLRAPEPSRPPHLGGLPEGEQMMLCLGTDYRHKNRLFALALLAELRVRHAWRGVLVLAGPAVAVGSSRAEERRYLDRHAELAAAVVTLGPVSEPEKRWLLEHARLVVYPTVQEGFGLVPFEAAEYGVPCLWAAGSSLSDLLADAAAAIVPWSARATAVRALELLDDERAREANLSAIRTAAADLRWDETAARLLQIYDRVCAESPSPAGVRERSAGLMRGGLSEDAIRLVGPNGALPPDVERPLLALATHRRLAVPAFALLRAGYHAARRTRRRR